MDFNVWKLCVDGSRVLWDGPLSSEDAEKVRFTRQRDENAGPSEWTDDGRKHATFVVVVEGGQPE